ncbi:peptide ABC transporter ATP-binding protein [Petrotoga miotherma DSM 10691]|jgi:peptide/nickel transport system ATP-binding protein|uniref:Peptide ABC transporter ATP-binding protein n=1 Tax=Petrotoga miotherma DSM 10691 TaxID=1434326 RepID=A0A2K1PES6_9BACT|nr:ABC transporter ATP-binding protein [Petrotoga miotherma]MDN5346046.1 hypothetical protein [Petrotoga sp.]PNS01258.1 peptide ABC transporter ATP-binding protein [Petrotoga miotherma DSM 10691]
MKENKKFSIQNVTKIFSQRVLLSKEEFKAVDDVTLEISLDPPEIFGLVGESGSGKSTLANIILQIIYPEVGKIYLNSKNIADFEITEFMKHIQPIFQDPFDSFDPMKKTDLFIYETIKNFNIAKEKSSIESLINESLKNVGLDYKTVKGKYPHEFSGGQLQRIAVARALVVHPLLLVADEPVSMLDASLRISIVNLFKELKEKHNLSVLYITHDLSTAYYISDRIGVMLRGNLVEIGNAKEILDEPLHPYTQFLKESVLEPDPTKKKITLEESEEQRMTVISEYQQKGCKFVNRCPKATDICKEKEPGYYSIKDRKVKCFLYENFK